MSTAATVDAPVADAAVAAAPRRKAFGVAFWVAAAWLGAVTLGALLVDHLPIPKKNDPDFLLGATVGNGEWTKGFTHRHLLGVDDSGNDLLTYALHGARVLAEGCDLSLAARRGRATLSPISARTAPPGNRRSSSSPNSVCAFP